MTREETTELLKKTLSRPIAFHSSFATFSGVTGAVMLSQALYWTTTLKEERDGWFYKTRDDWKRETGLSRREQEMSRKKLITLGILEEKLQGIPAKLWFRVNFKKLQDQLLKNSCQQVGTFPPNKLVQENTGLKQPKKPVISDTNSVPTYYTEITTESTSPLPPTGEETKTLEKETTGNIDLQPATELKSFFAVRNDKKANKKIPPWNRPPKVEKPHGKPLTEKDYLPEIMPLADAYQMAKEMKVGFWDVQRVFKRLRVFQKGDNKYSITLDNYKDIMAQWIMNDVHAEKIFPITNWIEEEIDINDWEPEQVKRRIAENVYYWKSGSWTEEEYKNSTDFLWKYFGATPEYKLQVEKNCEEMLKNKNDKI